MASARRLRGLVPAMLACACGGSADAPADGEAARAVAPVQGGHEGREGPAWNVLLVTLDTTRADFLGCYGRDGDPTPNLDRLAARGARFERCIATASVTPVSHASILTGRNPYAHGLRVIHAESGYELAPGVPTLAEVLRAAGWRTAARLSSFTVSEHFGLQRGFDDWDNGLRADAAGVMREDESGQGKWDLHAHQRGSAATTDAALALLEDWAAAEDPWLLWVHYWDPHDLILRPPEDFLARFVPPGARASGDGPPVEAYAAEVAWVDVQVGRLLDELERAGLDERTVVAVVADHGEGLGDHGWAGHRLLYQEHVRLPLIVRVPGGPAGVVVEELVRSIDVLPTVLEALQLEVPPGVEGASLLGLLHGVPGDAPRLAYADQLNLWDTNGRVAELRPQDDLLHVLMDRRWKLIHKPRQPQASELYDLERDPGETENLYRPDHPEVLRLLPQLEELDAFVLEPFPPRADGAGPDAGVEAALIGLGYVEGDEPDGGGDREDEPR